MVTPVRSLPVWHPVIRCTQEAAMEETDWGTVLGFCGTVVIGAVLLLARRRRLR